MRNARKLLLLAATAVAATALMVSSASAQTPLELVNNVTGAHCPGVAPNNEDESIEFPVSSSVTGGCVAHATNTEGSVDLVAHIFGIESVDSTCTNEFTARLDETGEGYLTNIELAGPNCTRRPCGTAAGAPEAWEVHGDELGGGSERLEAHFCVENIGGGGRQTCHIFVPFREDPAASSRYEFGTATQADVANEMNCEGFTGFRAEVRGHWKTETNSIRVNHTD